MPKCPKCASKLTKNKSLRIYSCRRHGFVREITPTYERKKEMKKEEIINAAMEQSEKEILEARISAVKKILTEKETIERSYKRDLERVDRRIDAVCSADRLSDITDAVSNTYF